ncbi:MAG: GNAT family N-acetyltransferase [Cyclobacteriaceae bacterium]
MNLEFRKATSADLHDALIMMQCFYEIDNYTFNNEEAGKNFLEFTNSDELGVFWLVIFEGEIIGYLILTFGYSFEHGGRDAFIDEFYIKEEHRGKGFGKEALKQLVFEVESLGIRAIHLEVEKRNTIGVDLYLKSGFQGNDRSLLTKKINQ